MTKPTLGTWVSVTARLKRMIQEPEHDGEEDYCRYATWFSELLETPVRACIVDITHRHNGHTECTWNWQGDSEIPPSFMETRWVESCSVPCLMVRERPGRAAYEVPLDGWTAIPETPVLTGSLDPERSVPSDRSG